MYEVFRHPNTNKTDDPVQRVIRYQERFAEGIGTKVARFKPLRINPGKCRGSDRRIDFLAPYLILPRIKNPDPPPNIHISTASRLLFSTRTPRPIPLLSIFP